MRSVSLLLLVACTGPENTVVPVDPTEPTGPTDPTEPPEPLPPLPAVVINEVVPGNDSTLNAPDGSMADWIELLNVGEEPVDMDELKLRDGDGLVWTGPAGEVLEPGGRFLVYAGEIADPLWTGFALSKDGDKLTLLNAADDRVVDYLKFDEVVDDVAWARIPDGTGDFVATAWTTPGETNGDEASPTLNPADETLFVDTMVHQIHFTMQPQQIWALDQYSRPEVNVQMDLDGIEYAEIGLKLKGSASYDTMDGKPAFIVDINQYVQGQKFRGLKKFRLHNGNVLDPTRVRDWITYKLAREAGLMAPRVGWAEVYVNKEYYGIYMVIEAHDDEMIAYHHPESELTGMMFEPNESSGGGGGWGDIGTGGINWNYQVGPEPPDQASIDSLMAANALFAGQPSDAAFKELWNYVDKEAFLTYLAWEAIVAHTDGYSAPNNWRVYIDGVTHKLQWVPSGAEWTWDNWYGVYSSNGNAARFCRNNATCRRELAEHVLTVADLADTLALQEEFAELSMWLDPIIQIDPRYSSWMGTVNQARSDTLRNLEEFPARGRFEVYQDYPDLAPKIP